MSASEWIAGLEAATKIADRAEVAYREESKRRTAELAQERAFAYRRLNLLRAVAGAVEAAPDEDAAVAHGLAIFRARLGWTTSSDSRDEIVSRFAPVCAALRGVPDSAEDGTGKDLAKREPPDPAAALAAFEAWYRDARGTPFWILFETYMPETPLVDW